MLYKYIIHERWFGYVGSHNRVILITIRGSAFVDTPGT